MVGRKKESDDGKFWLSPWVWHFGLGGLPKEKEITSKEVILVF